MLRIGGRQRALGHTYALFRDWGNPLRMLDSHSLLLATASPDSAIGNGILPMFHKVLIDSLGSQATRLLSNDRKLPTAELEKQFKALLHSALAKLDVVSREEFETQQTVLLRTRERLEALERKITELEQLLPADAP